MTITTRHHHLLSLLLREWEDAHAPIGPAKYLQVQELLRQTPTDQPLEQWRGRLAPLFCRNPQEQEQFYASFERCLQALKAIDPAETLPLPAPDLIEPDPKVEQAKKRWQASLYWLLAAVVGLLILLWFFREEEEETTTVDPVRLARIERLSLAPGDTLSHNLRPAEDTSTLRSATPRDWQTTPLGGLYRVDSTGRATYIANRDAKVGAVDTALILYDLSDGRDSVYWLADIIEPEKPIAVDTGLIAELPLPYPNNAAQFASLRIDEQAQARYDWYRRWQWPLKAALWLLLGALAWAIVRWDQYRRAKVVAELQRPERAPYIWSPETGLHAEDFLRADAAPMLTRLRGRSPDERERLDLRATLFASIRAGGRIQLRYRRSTLPPDYLLLIDRHAGQDHRARLFEALYQVFVQAEAPVSRYFYDGDPRTCFNERYPEGVALNELLQRHIGAQLMLLGEGQALLSNHSGRLAPWTNLLEAWPRRALLLTRPMQSWGRREKELQKLLPLLPASPAGLSAAIDLFNAPEPQAILPDLLRNVPDALQQPISFEHELIPDLQRQFSPELLDWIAACALWPTLHWDLTLYLGKVLSDRSEGENGSKGGETASILSFAGIRELTRLPWFVEGRIPDTVRLTLVRHLQERGLEQPLRQALAALLQQAPPPPADSVAYEDYRLNLIVNELFMRPNAQRKRELEREFAQYLAAGKQPDFVALQVLNRPQTALDVLVGDRLKKYAFKGGLPGLGWQLWTKLLGIWLACGLGIAFIQPFRSPCSGEQVQYQQQTYCLKDSRDRLLYLEQLAADAIAVREYSRVDSLVQAADALVRLDSAFYLNTATRYYNGGVAYFNCSKLNNCIGLSADSARQIACIHFTSGGQLSQRLLGQLGLEYYLAQQRTCTPLSGEQPVQDPPDTSVVIRGTVLDALSQSPIAGAQVRLNGQRTRSDRNGQYQFRVRASSLGTRLELQASATDYEPTRLSTPPQTQLPALRLSPSNTKLEREAWAKAEAANTPEAYTAYLDAFPTGPNAAEARKRISAAASAREQAAWTEAQRLNTLAGYQNFSRQYPNGAFANEAQNRIVELQDDADWANTQTTNTPAACTQYLQKYPNGRHAIAARQCANPAPPPVVEVPRPAMVRVPGGSFEMGDVMGDTDKKSNELPVHTVRLNAFEIGRYEVTFAEYDLFCEATKREKPDDENWGRGSRPIINVSWEDAVAYCDWLSLQHGYQPVYKNTLRDGSPLPDWNANGYRLPTEAEWEYAARGGGKKVRFGNGKDIADPKEINFYAAEDAKQKYSIVGEYPGETVPVGSLNSPNALGLHDMNGNVWEWCWDYYAKYSGKPESNPEGPSSGVGRVVRGGSWYVNPIRARVAYRNVGTPDVRSVDVGFRLARRQ